MTYSDRIIFCIEPFSECYPEAQELLRLHWDEIAPYRDLFTLNPNVELYEAAEKAGGIVIITARQSGALIGYIVMMLHKHMHYQHVLVATDDIHFIHPDHRKGRVGLHLIAAAEREMKRRGAGMMTLRTKVDHNHGLLFEHLGYDAQDVVYTKRLA